MFFGGAKFASQSDANYMISSAVFGNSFCICKVILRRRLNERAVLYGVGAMVVRVSVIGGASVDGAKISFGAKVGVFVVRDLRKSVGVKMIIVH